jgi:hypothetical protein
LLENIRGPLEFKVINGSYEKRIVTQSGNKIVEVIEKQNSDGEFTREEKRTEVYSFTLF